jgi:hypothetical protein
VSEQENEVLADSDASDRHALPQSMPVHYTRESQPIHSTWETAMTNRNWTRLDRWAWDRVEDVADMAVEGSGRRTYLSERS